MGGGSLILLLYGACFLFVLFTVGIGAGLVFYGRRQQRRNRAAQRERSREAALRE